MSSQDIHENTLCEVCHQKTLPEYYFCPNCGKSLKEVPLSTSFFTQLGLYLFSIILPSICFLFISKWKGIKYIKSSDPVANRIGYVALTLLLSSTAFTFWFAYVTTTQLIDSINSAIGTGLGGY